MKAKIAGFLTFLALFPFALTAAEPSEAGFQQWVSSFKQRAESQGISRKTLKAAFRDAHFNEKVIRLDRKQPESTLTFEKYLDLVINDQRIREGRQMLQKHRALLEEVSKKYGVQPRFIVALWGIETSYGKITGGYSIIEALATLAYEGRRAEFFEKELVNALKIIDADHIEPDVMQGSWAGAMGQSQFMPSSFLAFAQDYNGDGKRDIWDTKADVFASIANYLSKSGWNDEITWGRKVKLPGNFDYSQTGRDTKKSILTWQKLGVRRANGQALPHVDIPASIVLPGDKAGPAYMVYKNYDVIMKWNRSLFFATAVGILSDAINEK